jgi:DNA-binding transcriptional LysR family regulator
VEKAAIDLRRLRYFIAVCDHGGFSRAAHSIGVAQPALTRQIKLLETEMGLALINRTGRGAEPTEDGRFLLARSRQHLDGLDDIVRELRHRTSTLKGSLALGICPTIAPLFAEELTRGMRESHPKVSLTMIEAYSGDLKNLLDRGKLDMALTYRPRENVHYRAVELFSEPLVLVTAPEAGDDRRPRSLGEIARLKLILPSGIHELRRIIDRVCSARGIALEPDLELDTLDAVKAMLLRRGSGYATVLPRHGLLREADEGLLSISPIADSLMKRTIALVSPAVPRDRDVAGELAARVMVRAAELRRFLNGSGRATLAASST